MSRLAVWIACWLLSASLAAQITDDIVAPFSAGETLVGERAYRYRLLEPLPEFRHAPQPLVVFLHGSGERGDDNRSQLRWLPELFVDPEWRRRWPCFVLAVQCPENERWVDVSWREIKGPPMPAEPSPALRAVQQVVNGLLENEGVDAGRVYLTGLSMGGLGSWDLAMREPDRYAAVVPVCGGGDPRNVHRLIGLPIETWHGKDDGVISVERTREMVDALTRIGFAPRYREIENVGHAVWKNAYAADGALPWMFAQDQRNQLRGTFAQPAIVPRPDVVEVRPGTFRLQPAARVHAPEAARGLTSFVLNALELTGVRRPGYVQGVEPVAGDLVIELDAELGAVYTIEASDVLTLTARDVAGLRQGCAALYQALKTWPDLTMPYCFVAERQRSPRLRVELAWTRFRWTRDALRRLARELFLSGVSQLELGKDGRLPGDAGEWRTFVTTTQLLGIQIADPAAARAPADFRAGGLDGIVDVLQREVPVGNDGTLFEVALAGKAPDVVLRRMQLLLPAVAERAAWPRRAVHVSSFVSRVAARWR